MQEVVVTIAFKRPCLGAAKRQQGRLKVFMFERDRDGCVLFLSSHWHVLLGRAARVANRYHSLVKHIAWNPSVVGVPSSEWYQRTAVANETNRSFFVLHEAFYVGAQVTINAVLPDGIEVDDFWRLLDLVGSYWGYSPYNNQTDNYGTFDVVSIRGRDRQWVIPSDCSKPGTPA